METPRPGQTTQSLAAGGLKVLRDADWLTPERSLRIARLWLAVSAFAAVAWVVASHQNVDPVGKPIGADFASFWTASRLALGGHALRVYDPVAHHAAQTALFGRDVGYFAFFYPPIFLAMCLPLGALPYLASLGAWLTATGAAYAGVVARYFRDHRTHWVAILAFPAVFLNAGHGQNAFLSTALFGAGALMLDRRPWLAGVLLGCLAYKPQLGLVIPLALLAGGRWRTILGAAGAVLGAALASTLLLGPDIWRAFLAVSPLARRALEANLVGYAKMPSAFAAVRLIGGGVGLAYIIQAAVGLSACAALVVHQRRAWRARAEGPAMVAAALLASPFLLDYDLVLLAIPLAWLLDQALATGFRPYEKSTMAAAFVLPIVSRGLANATGVAIGPVVVALVFILVLRRWAEAPAPSAYSPPIAEI